jgi:hypothetical protein
LENNKCVVYKNIKYFKKYKNDKKGKIINNLMFIHSFFVPKDQTSAPPSFLPAQFFMTYLSSLDCGYTDGLRHRDPESVQLPLLFFLGVFRILILTPFELLLLKAVPMNEVE